MSWLLELVDLSLNSNYGKHGSFWYKGKTGIATGGSLSVSLANITVFYVLKSIIYDSDDVPDSLLGLKRFVDDLTGLWTGSKQEFITWADSVNSQLRGYGLSIKDNPTANWDFNPPGHHTVFLDIKYTFSETEGLHTDVNIKETDARVYLHFSSFHPRQTFPSIVYSQCLRYRTIINDEILLHRRLVELRECFVRSGYPKRMVDGIILDVCQRKRNLNYSQKVKTSPYRVNWVQTFSPVTKSIQKVVKEANGVIQESSTWKNTTDILGVVNRRAKNLGDMLLQRKRLSLDTPTDCPGTTRCTPFPKPGQRRKRGRPCASCFMASNKSTIKSTATGQLFKTPKADCKSKNLVYCAQCRICDKQYTGKTVNKLQQRISGHRSHVGDTTFDETDEAALAEHLSEDHNYDSVGLFNHSYTFTVLEISPHNLDQAEQRWVSRLVSMRPFGLNKEKPRGVADTVKTMFRRSLVSRSQR